MIPEINSVWLHLKTGKKYKVVQVGLWEETLEKCVVYVSLDKKVRCWIRPLQKKNGLEDLKKARKNLDWLIEEFEVENEN